ncbi:unnamed protein product [Polarella glacialis]|uniref:CSD domain-containing protein n=1 Tax=Polarella glacialis TaxID=89957 RepID=A0A813DVW5_POLGL|nr:unnamed protein product [Polarella glacialis]CAE8652491.1 unnamed protein product [Polarella glacialis]
MGGRLGCPSRRPSSDEVSGGSQGETGRLEQPGSKNSAAAAESLEPEGGSSSSASGLPAGEAGKTEGSEGIEKEAEDSSGLLREAELRRLQTETAPLDEATRSLLRDVAPGLQGRFEGNAYVLGPPISEAPKEADKDGPPTAHACRGTVQLFNAQKGYGILSNEETGNEAFFSSEGLSGIQVKEGDRVLYLEDHELIEGQVCAIDIKLRT